MKNIKALRQKEKDKTIETKEEDLLVILEVVYEMNLRGIALLPVDIYSSEATKFLIEGNALRPPFNSSPGVGDNAAVSMVEKRGTERFVSVEDFQTRTGANSGVIGALEQNGCFDALPKENQISLFSLD